MLPPLPACVCACDLRLGNPADLSASLPCACFLSLLQIASNPAWAAKQPWAGIAGNYDASRDPWKRGDLAGFRREFYQKTMQWLSSPGMKTYPVNEVFVWGMASWDMFGVYRESMYYRDQSVVQEAAAYNAAVIASQVGSVAP